MDMTDNLRSAKAAKTPDEPGGHEVPGAGSVPAASPDEAPAAHRVAEGVAAVAASGDAARSPASPGAMLAEARRRSGLSVGEVSNHLKLAIRQVEALEADAFERLPSSIFVRGFVKSYARLVQIDPEPVMQALEVHCPAGAPIKSLPAGRGPLQPPPSAIPLQSASQPSRRLHVLAVLLALVVAAFLAVEWFVPGRLVTGDAAQPDASLTVPAERPDATAGTTVQPVAPPLVAEPVAGAEPPAGNAAPPRVPAPDAGPAAASNVAPGMSGVIRTPASGSGERTLRLSFDRESWVEIRDGRGQVIFARTNPPGSSQVVRGEPPFALVIGNARGVRLADGERKVELAAFIQAGDVARLTLE